MPIANTAMAFLWRTSSRTSMSSHLARAAVPDRRHHVQVPLVRKRRDGLHAQGAALRRHAPRHPASSELPWHRGGPSSRGSRAVDVGAVERRRDELDRPGKNLSAVGDHRDGQACQAADHQRAVEDVDLEPRRVGVGDCRRDVPAGDLVVPAVSRVEPPQPSEPPRIAHAVAWKASSRHLEGHFDRRARRRHGLGIDGEVLRKVQGGARRCALGHAGVDAKVQCPGLALVDRHRLGEPRPVEAVPFEVEARHGGRIDVAGDRIARDRHALVYGEHQ